MPEGTVSRPQGLNDPSRSIESRGSMSPPLAAGRSWSGMAPDARLLASGHRQ
jgi:hypothetical protein